MMRLAWLLFFLSAPALASVGPARWKTLPVTWKVFNHTSIEGTSDFSKVLIDLQDAFTRWEAPSCSRWDSTYGGTFSSPAGVSAVAGTDSQNRVIWIEADAWERDGFHGASVLALTSVSRPCKPGGCVNGMTDEIVDADMEFNSNFAWVLGPGTGDIHIESVATHEAGHFAGLLHTENNASTIMTPLYNPGTIKVSLQPRDEADICTMYPAPGTVGQGTSCTMDSECESSAPVCRNAAGSSEGKICTKSCTGEADTSCGSGFVCRAANTGFACLYPVGSPDLCDFCTSPNDCSNNLCASNGRNNWCTNYCASVADCPGNDYDCVDYGGTGQKVCAPKANNCPGTQCSTEADCPVGFICDGNKMCNAKGTVNARCELSGFCEPCGVCIGTVGEAYCRPCCQGQSEEGYCASCANPECAAGTECSQLTASPIDAVCIPTAGSPTCAACDANTPCQDGKACEAGRCRLACNPNAPGTCLACEATGENTGYCACNDEVAVAGQACGKASPGSVAICRNEFDCVGVPSVCRTPCEPATSGSCRPGEECQSVDGANVCIPGSTAGARCAPCENNACAAGLQCVGGRCLEGCQVSNPSCQSCVAVSGDQGFCACEDSISTGGGSCGFLEGRIYACAPSYSCVDSTCRLGCDPEEPQCPPGSSCQEAPDGDFLCAGELPDAGVEFVPQPPTSGTTYVGCGCNGNGSPWALAWGVLALMPWLRRRRA